MTFADIPAATAVFVDANTFIYHFIAEPTYGLPSTELLKRVEAKEIAGWTSTHVLAEVAHRLMTLEAYSTLGWRYEGIASRLRRSPDTVQKLTLYRDALDAISALDINVASLGSSQDVATALDMSRKHGLLTNDALLVAQMFDHGVTSLASNDSDFDRVAGITRYAPV